MTSNFLPVRRSILAAALSFWACSAVQAAPVDDAVVELQHDWEVIRYQTPAPERAKRFEQLVAKAHKVSETFPGSARRR